MKNSWSPEQKLAFKVIFHIIILVVVIVLSLTSIQRKASEYNSKRETIVREYEEKIKLKNNEYNLLTAKTSMLEKEVDSLVKIKHNIITIYDEKINSIYDATAMDHAMWLDSITTKVSHSPIR